MAATPPAGVVWGMPEPLDLNVLLTRPAVVAAIRELGVEALGVEDVLGALRRFGAVRIDVTADRRRPFACVLQVAGEDPEVGRGPTVLHAALACWATTLESFKGYTDGGLSAVERFLAGLDGLQGEAA
jgi:hypothetical protein